MKLWTVIGFAALNLLQGASISSVTIAPPDWTTNGRSSFLSADYKRAAQSFEKAVAQSPDDAALHNWLGKSYARMAETANPLRARRDAQRAEQSLLRAVTLEPRNQRYIRDLFEFYVDSPEWIDGGLRKAHELEERLDAGWDNTGSLAAARREYSGPEWRVRYAIIRTTAAAGRILP